MSNIISDIKDNAVLLIYRLLYSIKPRYASEVNFYRRYHRRMNLKNPKDLMEKIRWLLDYSDTSMWTLCADKFRMRDYVAEKGLEDHLPKLYGHWENPDEINFDALPGEFVLKSNNGCGTVKIVKDKSMLDIPATKKLLKSWLKPYGYFGGQTHYLRIKPCIIAEELLHQSEEQNAFSPQSLVDYKMWCFSGEPESIWVAYNRHDALYVNMALYDTNWTPLSQHLKDTKREKYNPDVSIPKPVCLEEMISMAKILTKDFPEVRLDFYVIDKKPYIGEFTFTSGLGFYTEEYYQYLGSKVDLSKAKKLSK